MHFGHLVKPQDRKNLARPHLLRCMARGAAALGTCCRPGFSAVYPYLYGGTGLNIHKLGFIIVQVKNYLNIHGHKPSREDVFLEVPAACLTTQTKKAEDFPSPLSGSCTCSVGIVRPRSLTRNATRHRRVPQPSGEDGATHHIIRFVCVRESIQRSFDRWKSHARDGQHC
jgi:hypothetical protein